MANAVRWGILGSAKFAFEHMAPAIHSAARGQLVALASASPDKAAKFSERFPGLALHGSYEALLADPGIDAVYIPLPNHLHVTWAKKAAQAGKHVLCEKPMAMKAAEFDDLIALRDSTGLLMAEAYMIVHHPQWQRAREWVHGGEIGDLVQVDTVFSYNNAADGGNIRNRAETGGGAIPDIGVYTFGATRFVTGQEPTQILSANVTWENGVDVWSHVTAAFDDFHMMAVNSMRMQPRQEITFQGTKGLVRLPVPFNAGVFGEAQVQLHRAGQASVIERYPNVNQYVLQVEAFNRAVLDGARYACPLEFSKGTQAMIDMVYAKAARPE